MSAQRVCFDSNVLGVGLACTSRMGVRSTTVPAICPQMGEIPAAVEPPRGGNPYNRVRFVNASEWGKSHQWSCEVEILEGKNPSSRVQSPRGKSHSIVSWRDVE